MIYPPWNQAPENQWLEDEILEPKFAYFQGRILLASFQKGEV